MGLSKRNLRGCDGGESSILSFLDLLGIPSFPLSSQIDRWISNLSQPAMPALRKRNRSSESDAMPNNDTPHEHKMSEYELSREQRIRENRERMGKLGIFDLSLTLKLNNNNKRSYSSHKLRTPPSLPNPSAPVRRSSRFYSHLSSCKILFLYLP